MKQSSEARIKSRRGRSGRAALAALCLLVVACSERARPAALALPDERAVGEPPHLEQIVEEWTTIVFQMVKTAADAGRGSHKREIRWTAAEQAYLEQLRADARGVVAAASPDDRPWLLAAYVQGFAYYGIGAEWADAILDVPPEHPAWSGVLAWSLVDAREETRQQAQLRAYVHAAGLAHDAPTIDALSIYLQVEDADQAGSWARAHELYTQLESLQIPWGASTASAASLLDVGQRLDPDRTLRAGKPVPAYCGPVILGPWSGTRMCLDELFPHERPTLIIGWASWCGPCNEQLPVVMDSVRAQPIRVIAISYDEDTEVARDYLLAKGVDDWTVMLPRVERPVPSTELDFYPIPFLAWVDGQGLVEAGPPWLDAETLQARL